MTISCLPEDGFVLPRYSSLIVWLEEEAGVELDPGDLSLENFGSVSLMVSYLTERHGG